MTTLAEKVLEAVANSERITQQYKGLYSISWAIQDADLDEMEALGYELNEQVKFSEGLQKHYMHLHEKNYHIHINSTVSELATA